MGSAASAAPANRREKREALIVGVVVGVVGSVVEMEGVKKAVWVQALGESIMDLFIYLLFTICLMVGCLFRFDHSARVTPAQPPRSSPNYVLLEQGCVVPKINSQ